MVSASNNGVNVPIDPDEPSTSHRSKTHLHASQEPSTKHNEAKMSHWTGKFDESPLARLDTSQSARLPASSAYFQPGLFRVPEEKQANPAPLALSGFALTTFVLNLINLGAKGAMKPNIALASAIIYGGIIQILGGMWEMAYGNSFAAWTFTSYGGFWLSTGIILTPGLFEIENAYGGQTAEYWNAFGLFTMGWFVFTFFVTLCTLRSTLPFFLLLFAVMMDFLLLGISYLDHSGGENPMPNPRLLHAGASFGIVAATIAWWVMLAGLMDKSNSFWELPAMHFPWSEKGREARDKPQLTAKKLAPKPYYIDKKIEDAETGTNSD